MKKILYVTGSRAEYGIVRRLLTMLRETPEIQLDLAVTECIVIMRMEIQYIL